MIPACEQRKQVPHLVRDDLPAFVIPSAARDLLLSFAFAWAALLATPTHAADVPYLSGRVVDNAEILDPATRTAITE